jgi:hypothetical protein
MSEVAQAGPAQYYMPAGGGESHRLVRDGADGFRWSPAMMPSGSSSVAARPTAMMRRQ